jgi:hypothetical protein
MEHRRTVKLVTEIRGLSAYEIAVKNGFVGTEQQWLVSLQGTNSVNLSIGTVITLPANSQATATITQV